VPSCQQPRQTDCPDRTQQVDIFCLTLMKNLCIFPSPSGRGGIPRPAVKGRELQHVGERAGRAGGIPAPTAIVRMGEGAPDGRNLCSREGPEGRSFGVFSWYQGETKRSICAWPFGWPRGEGEEPHRTPWWVRLWLRTAKSSDRVFTVDQGKLMLRWSPCGRPVSGLATPPCISTWSLAVSMGEHRHVPRRSFDEDRPAWSAPISIQIPKSPVRVWHIFVSRESPWPLGFWRQRLVS